MSDWRYDYAINDTGDLPLMDLRVDVALMVTLDKLMCRVNDGQGEPPETDPREAS